jgi:protein TonB
MKSFLRGSFVVWLLVVPLAMLAPGRITAQDHSETARKIVARTAPQYPALARSMRIEGSVKADVLVAPNGTVKSVEIKGGHPLLVQSAQNALREWKWEPAPHETHEFVELKFAL